MMPPYLRRHRSVLDHSGHLIHRRRLRPDHWYLILHSTPYLQSHRLSLCHLYYLPTYHPRRLRL